MSSNFRLILRSACFFGALGGLSCRSLAADSGVPIPLTPSTAPSAMMAPPTGMPPVSLPPSPTQPGGPAPVAAARPAAPMAPAVPTAAPAGDVPAAPTGTPAPGAPAVSGMPAGAASIDELPAGFWTWPEADQLKWLQKRQAVLDQVKKFFETQKEIRDARKPGGAVGGAPSPSPVVVEQTKQGAPASGPMPVVERIYSREGVAYADLSLGSQGIRTVRAGSPLPDGMQVVEVNKEDVVVDVDTKRVSLPGAFNSGGPAIPPQPAVTPPVVDSPNRVGGSAPDARPSQAAVMPSGGAK